MRIVVTGGAGFVGSHLAERLVRERHQVLIVDDLNNFYSPALKQENLAAVRAAGPMLFHQCDICDEKRVSAIIKDFRPDTIMHLAARAGVRPSLESPLLYERTNVYGTIVLLEASRRYGVRKFVLVSSSSVYGIANTVPFREDDHLNLPISPYAASKLAAEKICYTYSHLYGLQVICLRLFTVYGPRQRPDLAIRKFTGRIVRDEPIPIYGDGSSRRDYTYVDDTVSGIMAALDYDCRYDIINLGDSQPVDLNTLICTIEDALEKKARIHRLPDQPGDVPITYADISKAKQLLVYNPATPFKEGIRKFARWYLARDRAHGD